MTPAPQSTVPAGTFCPSTTTPSESTLVTRVLVKTCNSQALQVSLRLDGKSLRIGGQNARPALIQKNASGCRVYMAKVMDQLDARHLRERAGHLNAYGSATDERERKLTTNFLRFPHVQSKPFPQLARTHAIFCRE